ncbi:MAG TPA: RNA polymerase sigma factor [Caulobacteraceae bacterium]|nr:RNA polymerase sigma factor [Caulobacteraceae bacterium]
MVESSVASRHDLELVALAVAGGRQAFGELVRRHGSAVRALMRRMGAAPDLADDLAQDAFLAAFEQITEFRGEGTFQAWVKKIAARAYVKRWRREARMEIMAETPEVEDHAPAAGDLIDLDEALRSLSAPERVCVSLCYGAGLSHSEAASALNAPLGTVKSHVKRGMDKLRLRLAPGRNAVESRVNG